MKRFEKCCYMVIDIKDGLPIGVYDSYREMASKLQVSLPTVWRSLKYGVCFKLGKSLVYVEKVLL